MTLDNPAKLFILVKAQVMRETMGALRRELNKTGLDSRLVSHLIHEETLRINGLNDAESLDDYIHSTRGITLHDWLDSLTWNHCI